MKTSKRLIQLVVSLLLVGFFSASALAGGPYARKGKISAINEANNVVVVQVPAGNAQMMTVAGPLASNAKLIKNGKKAILSDFHVGEKVVITWRKTKDTLPIQGLRAVR